ncbi:MAG: MBL fold metallo-hydrolase [Proteobacteria bacterium]|nr:MBL fold metallo-hydrolase [Pseudomonadota bacterium]MBU4130571.1 MBL fold metallo-hydrolase [Pseudomonadota bacterium]
MGKTTKKILGTVFGLVVLLSAGVLVKVHLETRKMSSADTGKIVGGVYAVQDSYVNLFLIKAHDTYVAIDAGNDAGRIQGELRRLQIDPEKVAAIFLTHSDPDHIAACSLFSKAVIYLSRAEEQMVNGQTARFLFLKNKLNYPHKLLEDNQIVTISGMEIKGISTPGHTPGSMCFLVNGTYLFTGDSMGLKGGKVTQFNKIFNMDSVAQASSIGRLAGVPGVEYIFTSHYGYTRFNQTAFGNWKE